MPEEEEMSVNVELSYEEAEEAYDLRNTEAENVKGIGTETFNKHSSEGTFCLVTNKQNKVLRSPKIML